MAKRRLCFLLACVLILTLFTGCSGSSTKGGGEVSGDLPAVKWIISNSQAPDHFYQLSYEKFADYVKEKSDGKFTIEVFHSGTLGNEQEVIENMQTGTIAGTLGAASLVANFVPCFDLFALPALFSDSDQLDAVMNDEEVVNKIKAACEDADLYYYGYCQSFFRELYTKKPVENLSDLRGQKVRVMGSDIIVDTFNALGANPNTTAWAELYSALQLGVCDGLDHIASSVQSMAFYENLGYVCEPNLFPTPVFILFSKPMYDELPEEYQALIDEAVENVLIPELLRGGESSNSEALEFLTSEGKLEYVECDVEAMQGAAAPVRDKYIEQLEGWVQEIAKDIVSKR